MEVYVNDAKIYGDQLDRTAYAMSSSHDMDIQPSGVHAWSLVDGVMPNVVPATPPHLVHLNVRGPD